MTNNIRTIEIASRRISNALSLIGDSDAIESAKAIEYLIAEIRHYATGTKSDDAKTRLLVACDSFTA